MDDLTELLRRIYKYSHAFELYGEKAPLFRLTPYEHQIFKQYLTNNNIKNNEFYGDIPTFNGIDFELVGKPILFNGKHIRSDSGIEVQKIKET